MEKKELKEALAELEKIQLEVMNGFEKVLSSLSQKAQEGQNFVRGIAIGLFYGIIGNILVSHYFKVFEDLILGEFGALFWTNLIVFVVALSLILIMSLRWYSQIGKWKTLRRELSEIQDELHQIKTDKMTGTIEKILQVHTKKKEKEKKT